MIWGVDLGTRKVNLIGFDGPILRTIADIVAPPSSRGEELDHIRAEIETITYYDSEPVIFVEEPPKVRNMRTFLHLAQTCGAVMSLPCPTYCVPVASWKKATVGKGNASKQEVSTWLRENYGAYYDLCGADQDRVDATCIGLYGQQIVDLGGRGVGLGGPD